MKLTFQTFVIITTFLGLGLASPAPVRPSQSEPESPTLLPLGYPVHPVIVRRPVKLAESHTRTRTRSRTWSYTRVRTGSHPGYTEVHSHTREPVSQTVKPTQASTNIPNSIPMTGSPFPTASTTNLDKRWWQYGGGQCSPQSGAQTAETAVPTEPAVAKRWWPNPCHGMSESPVSATKSTGPSEHNFEFGSGWWHYHCGCPPASSAITGAPVETTTAAEPTISDVPAEPTVTEPVTEPIATESTTPTNAPNEPTAEPTTTVAATEPTSTGVTIEPTSDC